MVSDLGEWINGEEFFRMGRRVLEVLGGSGINLRGRRGTMRMVYLSWGAVLRPVVGEVDEL